ncbi:anti-sigma factor [Micromonospora sp. NPDC051141]|uniref:anti-sigma factor n=1 Tax=Micromonospora sp. NPDC051141 TaxID=3364284 RepID=UPI0037A1D1CB
MLAAASVTAVAGAVGLAAAAGGSDPAGTMRLTATERAPGAAADVAVRDTPSGVEITMDTSGLPPAPKGTFYQAWVVGPGGSVAIGTFHLRGGSNEVVLWSGVGLDRYTKITVTAQQEGGGPASSGKVLLAGEVPTTLR